MSDKIAEIRARHAQSEKNYIELEATWKAQVHEDRGTLLAEVDRLREEIRCLGLSEALAKHSGSPSREWHSVGAWLYPGETINHVFRSPREEPEAKP